MISLTTRLLIAVSLVLGSFLGITGYTLDKTYQQSAQESVQQRLLGHVMTLIAATVVNQNGALSTPELLPVSRFNQLNSGLYAKIEDASGQTIWKSASMANINFQSERLLQNTDSRFLTTSDSSNQPLFKLTYAVSWETDKKNRIYTINIAESFEAYDQEISTFRRLLWSSLGGVSILLLLVQGFIWLWSLSPLRNAADEIANIEKGVQTSLEGNYPRELAALTSNINALINSNKNHLLRHRNALSDLAHSLKTPLALMRSATENTQDNISMKSVISEQVGQMQKIVDYQLQRAATSGRVPLSKPVVMLDVVQKIVSALTKVYADKAVKLKIDVKESLLFYGDESDLFELLGNLLDNAFKWCNQQVIIQINQHQKGENQNYLLLLIEDDGPGIDQEILDRIMQRGVTSVKKQGTGIGLAIVKDIAEAYEGDVHIGHSELGGARFEIRLQQAVRN